MVGFGKLCGLLVTHVAVLHCTGSLTSLLCFFLNKREEGVDRKREKEREREGSRDPDRGAHRQRERKIRKGV